jgi:hypothetical protein
MKIILPAILCFFFFNFSTVPVEKSTTYAEDFNVLVTTLREMHPLLYKNFGKKEFDAEVKKVSSRLEQISSAPKAIYIIEEFLYKIKSSHCGNLSIYGDLGITQALPFSVYIVDRELYIKEYPDDSSYNGTRIISIENTKGKDLVDSLKIFFPIDGKRELIMNYEQLFFNSLYGFFCGQKDVYSVKTEKGFLQCVAIKRGTDVFNRIVLKNMDAYFGKGRKLTKIITDDYGYFKFENFKVDKEGKNVTKEYISLIKELNAKKIKNLVIDLRGNNGGDAYVTGEMASYVCDHPFHVFDDVYYSMQKKPTFENYIVDKSMYFNVRNLRTKKEDSLRHVVRLERGIKTTNPDKDRFTGHIYVLVSSVSESASTMFCSYIMDQPNVTFVGSETAGAVNYFWASNMIPVKLPSMKTTFAFYGELLELKRGSSFTEEQKPLIPDVFVHYFISDLTSGRDLEMEWVNNAVRK